MNGRKLKWAESVGGVANLLLSEGIEVGEHFPEDLGQKVEVALDLLAQVLVLELLHVSAEQPLGAVLPEDVGVDLIFLILAQFLDRRAPEHPIITNLKQNASACLLPEQLYVLRRIFLFLTSCLSNLTYPSVAMSSSSLLM